MRRRSVGVLVIVVSTLAACGGSDDGDAIGADTSVSSTIGPVGPTDTVPATSPPPTDPPTTTSTSTTTTSTTTSPPTTVPEENCFEGSWWLSPEGTTALYANLLPGFPVTVTGAHWVEFAGNTVDYWVVTEARFTIGGADVTFGIDQHGQGTYTYVGDVLAFDYDTFESRIHDGHGEVITDPNQHPDTYADQAVDIADNGDGTITINRVTVPVIEIPPVAGGPVTCGGGDTTTMSLVYTSGLADTVAIYQRQA